MKHNEKIFDAMSGIDADIVTAAAPGNRKKQHAAWKKWLPSAACFVLAAVLGIAAWQMHAPDPVDKNDHLYSDTQDTKRATEAAAKVETVPDTQHELAVIPRWDEMTLPEQFGEFHVGETRYSTRVTAIDAAHVGEKLGESTSKGYDIYTDTAHEMALAYYAIHGISTECALAAQFEGDDGYYVYVNSWYRPETLEDLITALNLRESMTFGDFHASYFYENRRFEQVTFHDPDDSIVWERLLSDTSLENVWQDTGWYGSTLSVSVNIPLLGYENISLWVTEDGHLCTNILDTGKAFFIGKEKVEQFLYYVVMNCTDREVIVHDYGPIEDNGGAETAVEGEIVEMTTQGYNPDAPQTATAQTTAAAPRDPAQPNVTVTSPAYNPQFTTSEE